MEIKEEKKEEYEEIMNEEIKEENDELKISPIKRKNTNEEIKESIENKESNEDELNQLWFNLMNNLENILYFFLF